MHKLVSRFDFVPIITCYLDQAPPPKPQGVSKCRYTTSSLSKRATTSQQAITRGTMADNENTKAQAEEDHLLMSPPLQPATRSSPEKESPQKTGGTSMTLRPRKNKNKGKDKLEPEPVATATITGTDTADTTGTNDNTDTKEPENGTEKPDDDAKPEDDTKKSEEDTKPEDDLPPIEPLNWRERLLFPGIIITEPRVWYDVPMSPKMKELWRKVAPQAGDRMLTVDEVDKLCDEFYKESLE